MLSRGGLHFFLDLFCSLSLSLSSPSEAGISGPLHRIHTARLPVLSMRHLRTPSSYSVPSSGLKTESTPAGGFNLGARLTLVTVPAVRSCVSVPLRSARGAAATSYDLPARLVARGSPGWAEHLKRSWYFGLSVIHET